MDSSDTVRVSPSQLAVCRTTPTHDGTSPVIGVVQIAPEQIGLTADEKRVKDALLAAERLGDDGLADAERCMLHVLLARERLARYEAKWSPRTSGMEPHVHRKPASESHALVPGVSDCKNAYCSREVGAALKHHDAVKDLQGQCGPAQRTSSSVKRHIVQRRVLHMQARRKNRLDCSVASRLLTKRAGDALSPRTSKWVGGRVEDRRLAQLRARRRARLVSVVNVGAAGEATTLVDGGASISNPAGRHAGPVGMASPPEHPHTPATTTAPPPEEPSPPGTTTTTPVDLSASESQSLGGRFASLIEEVNGLDWPEDITSSSSSTSADEAGSSSDGTWMSDIDVSSVSSDASDAAPGSDNPPSFVGDEPYYKRLSTFISNRIAEGFHPNLPSVPAFVSGARLRYLEEDGRPVCLGAGVYGAVYAAQLEGFHEPVCVKVFKGASSLEPNLDIMQEAALLSALNGTDAAPECHGLVALEETKGYRRLGIVQSMICVGDPAPSNTLTLEGLLKALKAGTCRYPEPHWPTFCAQLVECLCRVHQRGVIMNDIKVDNIMLRWAGGSLCPVLVDTGLAKYRDRQIGWGPHADPEALIAQYMQCAPEIFLEDQCHEKSDVYSLGLVFQEISGVAGAGYHCLGQYCRARPLNQRLDLFTLQYMLMQLWQCSPPP